MTSDDGPDGERDAAYFRARAALCRALAGNAAREDIRDALIELAREFEAEARCRDRHAACRQEDRSC